MHFFQDHTKNEVGETTDSLKACKDEILKAAMKRDFSEKDFSRDQRIAVREWSHIQAVGESGEDIARAGHKSDSK
jgi:hypothetical protein